MVKTKITRGTRKRFTVSITDTADVPQDPDSCVFYMVKVGEYAYDSPLGPYTCTKVGATGEWAATNILLPDSMTLGDWIGRFRWWLGGIEDGEDFEYIVEDKDRPWLNQRAVRAATEVVA